MAILERLKHYRTSQTTTDDAKLNKTITMDELVAAFTIISLNITFSAAYTGTITITIKETSDAGNLYNKTYTTSSLSGVTSTYVKGIDLSAYAGTITVESSANIGAAATANVEVLVEQVQTSAQQ